MKIETRYRGKFLSEYTKEELIAIIEEFARRVERDIAQRRHEQEVLGDV